MTRLVWALLGTLVAPAPALAFDPMATEPRVVLALYDGAVEADIRHSLLHSRFELPLNHLGLILRYHDVRDPMPAIEELDDVRGAISWLHETVHGDPGAYVDWLASFLDSGRRVVIVGELGATPGDRGVTRDDVDALWARLGLSAGGDWVRMTYDLEVLASDDEVVGFERKLGGVLPGYPVVTPIRDSVRAHLTVARRAAPDTASTLVATGTGGGFIAPGYAVWAPDETTQQWLVNPFRFCRLAFDTDAFPKPDTTTVSGRRIFYSHIDGDGWRNRSLIPSYRKQRALSAEVVYRELLVPFPDLPVSVAPVVGDLDPAWHGSAVTLGIARDTFALPHVEAGSHTYSHPLDWGYFAPDGGATAVDPKVGKADEGWLDPVTGWVKTTILGEEEPVTWNAIDGMYDRPRSYLIGEFDLDREIRGSVEFLEALLPTGKKVGLVQWSGNTRPFPEAIAAVRALGLRNINGGDSRFDFDYPSYSWVAPLGIRVGEERQIYASNSNENTYTDLWTDRFFGFKHLVATVENTETPIRVRPFNIYYHMYSGERLASLNAVLDNLRLAMKSRIAPIETSRYAAIADGFYSAQLERLGPSAWRVHDRDGVETMRFDGAAERAVDWSRSSGVIGETRFQGNLYVALDGAVDAPVVALTTASDPESPSPAHLLEGRYLVSDLDRGAEHFSFTARGFGRGEMSWRVRGPGDYEVVCARQGRRTTYEARADERGRLDIELDFAPIQPTRITVRRATSAGGPR